MSDLMDGTWEIEGLVSYAEGIVRLELQKNISIGIRTDAAKHEIPLEALQVVELKRGPFKWKILIETNSLTVVSAIPGSEGNRLVLFVAKRYREIASDLVTHIQIELTERRLSEL